MGAKISKRGSYKLRKKEKGKKIERQTSIISLTDAQIYEDFLDDLNQSEVEVFGKELPSSANVQVEINFDFSMQMENEFNAHLKSIVSEEVSQIKRPVLINKTSTNTLYHDISEENDSFYDAQDFSSVDLEEEKKSELHDKQFTENSENWAIVSLGEHTEEETHAVLSLSSVCDSSTTKIIEVPTYPNNAQQNQSINVVEITEEVKEETDQNDNSLKPRESPVQLNVDANLDFKITDYNLELNKQEEKSTHIHSDAVSLSSDEKLHALTSAHLDPIIHVVTKQYSNSDSESSKSTETSEEKDDNFDAAQLVFDTSDIIDLKNSIVSKPNMTEQITKQEKTERNSLSTKFFLEANDRNYKYNDDFLITSLDSTKDYAITTTVLNEDDIEKPPSLYSLSKEEEFEVANQTTRENSNKAMQDKVNLDLLLLNDKNHVNSDTIDELKAIIESIYVLETKISDTETQIDTQNTYQKLIKIMMQVNHIKNENFDEEIINLQNTALNQINLCLKILKK